MPNLPYDYDREEERRTSCRVCGEPVDFLETLCDECLGESEREEERRFEEAYLDRLEQERDR